MKLSFLEVAVLPVALVAAVAQRLGKMLSFDFSSNTRTRQGYLRVNHAPSSRAFKGQFGNLVQAAIGLAIFGVVLTLGAVFNAELGDTASVANDANATAVVGNVGEGFVSFSGFIPLIVLAIVFVLIIGLLFLVLRQGSGAGGF